MGQNLTEEYINHDSNIRQNLDQYHAWILRFIHCQIFEHWDISNPKSQVTLRCFVLASGHGTQPKMHLLHPPTPECFGIIKLS